MKTSRTTALAFLLTLMLAGCGARLTDQERAAGVLASSRGGGGTTVGGAGGPAAGPGTSTGGGPGAGGPGTSTGGGPAGGPTTGLGSSASGPNGGATDVGVSATELRIATVSDISGVQPGLFRSTHQAIQAWAAMVNSQGGLFGRRIRPILMDSKAETGANRAAVQDACNEAFALVGSMSAFDNGGASVGENCEIPDITAIPVNASRQVASNVFAVNPIRPDKFVSGTGEYIKRTYPDEVKAAGMLYLNAGVTKSNAQQRRRAYESIGFNFIYFQEVQVVEANYTGYVQAMRERGVRYINMVANYQSIQQLLDAFDKANWRPDVVDWDSVAYSPNFLVRNGRPFTPAEGSLLFTNTALSEESSSNPELQTYMQWLSRVAPGAKPDFFGFYAWSAAKLFMKVHQDIGPKITRKAFIEAIKKVHSWDGNGLHVAHDVGGKLQSKCFGIYLEVKGGKFVRRFPSSGFDCSVGRLINT